MGAIKSYMQTAILKPNKRQEPSKVNGQNQSQAKQQPKAKSQVGMQMGDSSYKMQQIARKAAPGWKKQKTT